MNFIERMILRKEFNDVLKLTKGVHSAAQGIALAIQAANAFGALVPQKYQGLLAAMIGLLQAILALQNHGAVGALAKDK